MANIDDETVSESLPPGRPAGELPPGTLLNGIYRIEGRIGAGGMGEVYRATNIANDEQDAIKIIGRGRADQTLIEAMFRKEARVLSRIRAPAVAQLKLFARDTDLGLLYFVTDFVSGESLLDRLKRRPGSPDELRALLGRLLRGLQVVHEAGAVHRDLSPDNIILPDGDPAEAKIIDFGIAKELDPAHTTMVGDSLAGKLGYIAPEQLGFSGAEVGPWTDLYSLALVGVAFAAGKPLDMGATVGRAEEARRGPIDLASLPDDLRPVFARLLTYDWRERPQTAGEALAMLEGSTAPLAPPPPPPPAMLVAPPARPASGISAWLVIGGILLLVLVAGGTVLLTRLRPAATPVATPVTVTAPTPTPTAAPSPAGVPVAAIAASSCGPVIHIAFPRNESTSVGWEPLISGAVDRVTLCRPTKVTVIGRADTKEEAPAALAGRRADKIAAALRRAGIPAALLHTSTAVGTAAHDDLFQNKVVEISFGK